VRSRADAAQREGPGAADAPPAHRQRRDRLPLRRHVRPAGGARAGPAAGRLRPRRVPLVPRRRPLDARRAARPLRRHAARVDDVARRVNVSKKIDVHAHYLPDAYRAALLAAGHDRPDGFPQVPDWSVEEHLAAMDRLGIATSLLSISSPGIYFGD